MRCNACWRELEGRAITTTCGHILCPEDANKIISNDGSCPICDQVLSKSLVKAIDINPNDEWINMVMAGVSPQICILRSIIEELPMIIEILVDFFFFFQSHVFSQLLSVMKSAYRSVSFYIGQKELEMQVKMSKVVAQYRQKCESMQEKFTEKLEQVYTAYQKKSKQCQMMEQEIESLSKDKQELQEKFAENCRQKRKLEEMYDLARTELEPFKRSAIQPVNHFFPQQDNDLFPSRMDRREPMRRGPREDVWPGRRNSPSSGFDISSGSPLKQSGIPMDGTATRNLAAHASFGVANRSATGNPSQTLRNLILSPIKRPQLSRSRPQLFTL